MSNKFNITSIHQVGKRDHNEDSIFPNEEIESPLDNLFLVCDGVGGHAKGEIASDLICTQIASYFASNQIDISNSEIIQSAIKFVETKFDSYIVNNPESAGMASTLTLLHLHKGGATVAHIGDSRVYQFRQGEIIFRTKDHSLVQNLFDLGELTSEEEMANHPRRNEITRAIQGASIQKVKADVTVLHDIRQGDIFLLCTDGILESFSDEALKAVFEANDSIDTIAASISMQCSKTSKDNFSAYFVEINKEYLDTLSDTSSSIENGSNTDLEEVPTTSEIDNHDDNVIAEKQEEPTLKHPTISTVQTVKQPQTGAQDIENIKEQTNIELNADIPDNSEVDDELLKKAVANVERIEKPALKKEVKINTPPNTNNSYKKPATPISKKNRRFLTIIGLFILALIIAIAAFIFMKNSTKKSEFEKIKKSISQTEVMTNSTPEGKPYTEAAESHITSTITKSEKQREDAIQDVDKTSEVEEVTVQR